MSPYHDVSVGVQRNQLHVSLWVILFESLVILPSERSGRHKIELMSRRGRVTREGRGAIQKHGEQWVEFDLVA